MGYQGPNWMSVTIHLGHELQAFTKTQMPCTIMPQNRWTSTRYPDWESEDVSDTRDTEPQPCVYHDVISLSSACTALVHGSLLVYGLVLPKVAASRVPPDKAQGSPLHQERTFRLPGSVTVVHLS
jgi:hypothetical protein